jgi:hypothetical protein
MLPNTFIASAHARCLVYLKIPVLVMVTLIRPIIHESMYLIRYAGYVNTSQSIVPSMGRLVKFGWVHLIYRLQCWSMSYQLLSTVQPNNRVEGSTSATGVWRIAQGEKVLYTGDCRDVGMVELYKDPI